MKNILTILSVSLLSSILLIPLRKTGSVDNLIVSMQLSLMIGSIVYFCMTLYFFRKFDGILKLETIVIFILLGILLLRLPFHLWKWHDSLITLPDLLGQCIAILVGGIYYRLVKNRYLKSLFLLFSLAAYFIFIYWGYNIWLGWLSIQIWS